MRESTSEGWQPYRDASKYTDQKAFIENRKIVMRKYNGKCHMCGDDAAEVHHIDLSKDNHNIENLLPLCMSCHSKIHNLMRRITDPGLVKRKQVRDELKRRFAELAITEHEVWDANILFHQDVARIFGCRKLDAFDHHSEEVIELIKVWTPEMFGAYTETVTLKEAK